MSDDNNDTARQPVDAATITSDPRSPVQQMADNNFAHLIANSDDPAAVCVMTTGHERAAGLLQSLDGLDPTRRTISYAILAELQIHRVVFLNALENLARFRCAFALDAIFPNVYLAARGAQACLTLQDVTAPTITADSTNTTATEKTPPPVGAGEYLN